MAIVRCPECGSRLNSSYCPMCMKHVIAFPGRKKEIPWQQRKYTSQHQEEHKCITFEEEKPKTPAWTPPVKKQKSNGKGIAALLLAGFFTVVVPIFTLIGDLVDDAVSYEEIVTRPEPVAYVGVIPGTGASVPGVEPHLLYDDGSIQVTIDSAGHYYEDYALAYTVENTADRDITVTAEYLVVNGWMMDGSNLFCQAAAGETVQEYLRLSAYDLDKRQISTVSDIQLQVVVYDSEDYTDIGTSSAVTVRTEAEPQPRLVNDSGRLLLDWDGVRILYQGYEVDDNGWYSLLFFLENTGQMAVTVYDQGIYANGQQTDEYFWCQLRPDTCGLYEMSIYDVEESLGVTDLSQINDLTVELCLETEDFRQTQEKLSFDPNGPLT